MKILYDTPGQTFNRLWSYITTLAECIENNDKMAILFFDYTLFDFPKLKNNQYNYYPFKNEKIIESIGYKQYMKLLYLLFGNKFIRTFYSSKLGSRLGFIEGWSFRMNNQNIQKNHVNLYEIFKPDIKITQEVDNEFLNIKILQ